MALHRKQNPRDTWQGNPLDYSRNGIQGSADRVYSSRAYKPDWETDKANNIASAILNEHQNLQAILCANDNMALGAVAAIKAAGKTGQVLVIGFDNNTSVQQLMKEGKILCTVDQHADQIAVKGIQYALQILEKKGMPEDYETRVDLITPDSLK